LRSELAEFPPVKSDVICAIIASEFVNTGLCEISSFHGFVTGKICMADTTASAFDVSNKIGLITTGNEPRMRPSWLIRSAGNRRTDNSKINTTINPDILKPVQAKAMPPEINGANT
jgi:hypothetical protein